MNGQEEALDQAPRVLVTGATGLLGRAVCREFQSNSWVVIGVGFRRARPGILRCDLTDGDAVRGLLQDYKVLARWARSGAFGTPGSGIHQVL